MYFSLDEYILFAMVDTVDEDEINMTLKITQCIKPFMILNVTKKLIKGDLYI